MKKARWITALLVAALSCSVAGVAVACGGDDEPPEHTTHPDANGDGLCDIGGEAITPSGEGPGPEGPGGEEKPAPTSISITNEANPHPGAFEITVEVQPAGADASFTAALIGEHTLVSLSDNEVAISEDIDDGYEFTVEVTSAVAPAVKAQKTFTVDNRPEEGVHITTLQRTVDAQQNEGKLQLRYTVWPEQDVTFSLEEACAGVTVSGEGLISLDPMVDNRITFTVRAASADGQYSDTVTMEVKNEVEREIADETALRAIWTGNNEQSVRNMRNFYKLTSDIALTSPWTLAIGYDSSNEAYEGFTGSFNGNGHTISNFNMNAGWNSGLFYRIGEGGIVKNLALTSGKGAGEGVKGMFSGPFAGYLLGTIENCIADVRVDSDRSNAGVTQPMGTFLGTLTPTGKIYNSISLGQAYVDKTGEANPDITRDSGFVASFTGSVFENCVKATYSLEGTSNFVLGHNGAGTTVEGFFKTMAELRTAATYPEYDEETGIGFDRDIWRIVDGALPCLKNDNFAEPASVAVTFGGEEVTDESITVEHGRYAVLATVKDGEGSEAHVPQSVEIVLAASDGAEEGAFTLSGNEVVVDGTLAKLGDTCTVTVTSLYQPSATVTFTLEYDARLAVVVSGLPEFAEYTVSGGTLDLSEYVTVLNGSDAELTFTLSEELAGVTLTEAGVLTLTAESDNTSVIKFTVAAELGDQSATSDECELPVKNLVPKAISSADQFNAIWTGDNALSRVHMHNNYVLTQDIDLGGEARVMGIAADGVDGYGLFGTLDGAGYTLSWTNTVEVGWNSGFIPKVEEGGVIKNLNFKGTVKGAICGPIGLVCGTVENCFFDVTVIATNANQQYGSAVGILGGHGVIRNLISVGEVTGVEAGGSAVYGKTFGTSSTAMGTATNCYALEGTVKNEAPTDKDSVTEENIGTLTEEEMRTAATFDGWDTDVWYFGDGAYPTLKYDGFQAPASISAKIAHESGGEVTETDGKYVLTVDSYTVNDVSILPAGAVDEWAVKLTGAEECVELVGENGFRVNANAVNNTEFTVTVYSKFNPSIKVEFACRIESSTELGDITASFGDDTPETLTYTQGGPNEFDLTEYLDIENGSGNYTVTLAIGEAEGYAAAGVSTDGAKVVLSAECDNTAKFTVTATVQDTAAEKSATTAPVTIEIVNEEFKELNTEDDFKAIWTGNNAISHVHMHNNYIFMSDITLNGATKVGLGIDDKSEVTQENGYGIFGTWDGNGHELYWTGGLSVGWNSGLIAKLEQGGVVKNLKFSGTISGTIAGTFGLVNGTVENCLFNVTVSGTHALQPNGAIAAAIGANGTIRHCIVTGSVTFSTENTNGFLYGKSHGTSEDAPATVSDVYGITGNVFAALPSDKANVTETNVALKSEDELKVDGEDPVYSGWDTTVWKFTAGELPALNRGCTRG